MSLHPTASQTVGSFHRIGLSAMTITDIAGPEVPGERVTIRGRVLDGDGNPVNDALIEVWQANAEGKYSHPDDTQEKPLRPQFLGFGRAPTDDDGAFHFTTIKPGPVPGARWPDAGATSGGSCFHARAAAPSGDAALLPQ
jgi:protocatechuate 3,4-dioxygenase alpha subunit